MKNLTEIENLQELRNPMVIKDRMTMCTRNNYTIMMLGSKSLAVSLHNFLLIFLTKNSNLLKFYVFHKSYNVSIIKKMVIFQKNGHTQMMGSRMNPPSNDLFHS